MQRPHRFLTTSHRRQRLVLWALAMLSWVSAVLFADADIRLRHVRRRRVSFAGLKRLTVRLLIVRSMELVGVRPKPRLRNWRYGRDLRRRHYFRSLIGGRLRRVMGGKHLAATIAALVDILRNLDVYAGRLAQRMRRLLTRLFPILAGPGPAAFIPAPPACAPAPADSS